MPELTMGSLFDGIGIRNVDQRMKLVFGEEYGLALSKAPEGGLRVTLHYKTI